jgi:hypothetical protein
VLGQVAPEPKGVVGGSHGNKGDALVLVVDKVVQRHRESIGVLKHIHDGLVEVWWTSVGLFSLIACATSLTALVMLVKA